MLYFIIIRMIIVLFYFQTIIREEWGDGKKNEEKTLDDVQLRKRERERETCRTSFFLMSLRLFPMISELKGKMIL